MNFEEIIELVKKQMPEVELGESKQFPVFIVKADQLHFLARFLKETPQLHMDFLICLTAAEGKKDDFNMIYILTSSEYMHKVMIKVPLSTEEEHPVVPTVSDLWRTAEFQEREVYDLFGIHFENHPDLRRLFLDEGWEGHPLRKDYKDPFILEN